MLLVDTDVVIDLTRKWPPAIAWFTRLPTRPYIFGFAALDLIYGCPNAIEQRKARRFLRPFLILWPTEEDMCRVLLDYAPLNLSHGLGIIDALVAATAIGHSLPVATFNVKHFRAIPGLTILQPYVR